MVLLLLVMVVLVVLVLALPALLLLLLQLLPEIPQLAFLLELPLVLVPFLLSGQRPPTRPKENANCRHRVVELQLVMLMVPLHLPGEGRCSGR
ncbi:MAG: hypothetical protein ABJX82_21610 [Paracoccaceae bacterium]